MDVACLVGLCFNLGSIYNQPVRFVNGLLLQYIKAAHKNSEIPSMANSLNEALHPAFNWLP